MYDYRNNEICSRYQRGQTRDYDVLVYWQSVTKISLGYTFSYHYHRKGYAFESLTALINLLHGRYPEWNFICYTEPENEASMALLKKLGYKDMGYIPSTASQVFGKWTTPAKEAEIAQATTR